jgi:DNA repair exonuclease SbcCD ATPase subunit
VRGVGGWRDEAVGAGAGEPEGSTPLASTVSAEVRAIFEAAERSAEEIRRQSEREATAVREAAAQRARQIRSEAIEQARTDLTSISENTGEILEDLERRMRELASLVEELRSDADRLAGDLAAIDAPREVPAPVAAVEDEPDAGEDVVEARAAAVAATAPFAGEPDEARLLALNMALNGAPREEIERYLAENFDLEEPDRLLNAVYRRVGR